MSPSLANVKVPGDSLMRVYSIYMSSSAKHHVQEQMTEAFLKERRCNKCKTPYIKEGGCNEITCSRCSNKQCYRCKKDILGHSHFGSDRDPGSVKCRLFDDTELELQKTLQINLAVAQSSAIERARQSSPISVGELKVDKKGKMPAIDISTYRKDVVDQREREIRRGQAKEREAIENDL